MSQIVPASGPRNAKLAFVGIAPAAEELRTGLPFMGAAGRILNSGLEKLGLTRKDVWVGNVHDEFIPSNSIFSLPLSDRLRSINRLQHELKEIQPNVVVPLGDEALHVLCGLSSITKWRGSILPSTLIPGVKCVPTVHPSWISRGMWKWEPVFTHIDLKRAIDESSSPEISLPKRDAITGPSFHTVLDYIEECKKHDILSVDIEVYGYTETGTGEIACVGIGFQPNQSLCIPFVRSGGSPYWGLHEEGQIWSALASLLQNESIKKVGQNLAFEWIYFWLHNIYPSNMYIDTMLLHHTLYPDFGGTEDIWGKKGKKDEPGHSLAFINSQYSRTPYYKDDGRRWSPKLGDHQFWVYNCKDVMVTLDCALKLRDESIEEGLWDFYVEYHVRPFPHSCRMEWEGVAIDIEKRAILGPELVAKASDLQDRVNQKLGYALNVNSPKQMMSLLYEKMGLKIKKKKVKKDGGIVMRPTADKDTLRFYAEQTQDDVLVWIQELRSTLDLKGDIVDQKLGTDNRMHTHYKQGGTDSNRWSSVKSILGTGTNLQNIPREGVARQLFIPV